MPTGPLRARTAVVIDALVVIVTVAETARARLVIVGIGAALVALGALATRVHVVGYALTVVRVLVGFVLLALAAQATILLLLPVGEGVSAISGYEAARTGRRRRDRPPRRRLSERISKRTDDIWSAVIHFGFVAMVAAGVAADGRVVPAFGFVLWWIALAWGTLGVHELGHALAARHFGNEVPEIHFGTGLTLLRFGTATVGAIPFLGHTHWIPNESTMTARREALIALAGPGANLLVAALLFAIPAARANVQCVLLIGSQVAAALLNLVPTERTVRGRVIRSDGARALRLLHAHRAVS